MYLPEPFRWAVT